MERDRYLVYKPPHTPHVEWTDAQLFDEVDFIATHRTEIQHVGERDEQLKDRMRKAVGEQGVRYFLKKQAEEEAYWIERV